MVPFSIICYIQRAIRTLGQATGAVQGSSRSCFISAAGKTIRKDFPFTGRFTIVEGYKSHKKSFLRFGCPVPGTMESNKCTVLYISRGTGYRYKTVVRWAQDGRGKPPPDPLHLRRRFSFHHLHIQAPEFFYPGSDRNKYRAIRHWNPYAVHTYILQEVQHFLYRYITGGKME